MRIADTLTCLSQTFIFVFSKLPIQESQTLKALGFQERYQSILSTSFLVVRIAWSLLSGDVNEPRKLISFDVLGTSVSKKNLKKEIKTKNCQI